MQQAPPAKAGCVLFLRDFLQAKIANDVLADTFIHLCAGVSRHGLRFGFPDSQAKVSGSVGDLNASRLKPPKKFTLLHDLLYWLNT